jgi:hypothetical protein
VAGDQLCHRWSRWLDSEQQCLRLRKEGRIIRWRTQDGTEGIATIKVPAPVQTATVVGPLLPTLKKDVAPPQAPPAPLKHQEPEGAPKEPAAEIADAGKHPQTAVKPAEEEAVAPPQPVETEDAPEKGLALPQPPAPKLVVPKKEEPPEKQAEPKRATEPTFKVAKVRSDDVLNVRSGPSSDFEIVGALPPGTRGIAITSACRSQWCPVKHQTMSGWVNSAYLMPEAAPEKAPSDSALLDSPEAPRSCLTPAARALLDRIEQQFGPVQVISTCRPGATIPGTGRPSRHASGNAVDFKAGSRKSAIIAWLIANHRRGGTMTYAGMDHIHVDIGPYFVSIAGGPRWASWRGDQPEFAGPPW